MLKARLAACERELAEVERGDERARGRESEGKGHREEEGHREGA